MDPVFLFRILGFFKKKSVLLTLIALGGGYFFYVQKTGRNIGQDIEKAKEIKQKFDEKTTKK